MRLRRYRPVAIVLLVLHLSACTTWRPSPIEPRQLIEEERPSAVRITKTDGTEQVVREPRIQGDSIAMTSEDCRTSVAAGASVAGGVRILCETTTLAVAALGDVRGIEIRQSDTGKTILLIVLLAPVALVVTLVVGSYVSCQHVPCG